MNDIECRVLRQTAYLLEDKERWIKNTEKQVVPGQTVRYCILGALREVCSEYGIDSRNVEKRVQKQLLGFKTIPEFNDANQTTHQDVVNVLQRAAQDC